MAIQLVKREYCEHADDYICDFIVDSTEDLENLPECCAGSTALSPSGDIYMVNASNEWVEFGG